MNDMHKDVKGVAVSSPYTYGDREDISVLQYLKERENKAALRANVMTMFDKHLNAIVAADKYFVKGMPLVEAFDKGTDIIANADYMFLMELRNCKKGDFLSVLFDIYDK